MTAAADPRKLADTVREALRVPPEGHHRFCATRRADDAECDCFMRSYTPALAALDALVSLAEQLQRERDEALQVKEEGLHVCDTVEEGWRPCPADLCEGEVLLARLTEDKEEIRDLRKGWDGWQKQALEAEALLAQAIAAMDEVDGMFVHGWRRNDVPERSKDVIERWDSTRAVLAASTGPEEARGIENQWLEDATGPEGETE